MNKMVRRREAPRPRGNTGQRGHRGGERKKGKTGKGRDKGGQEETELTRKRQNTQCDKTENHGAIKGKHRKSRPEQEQRNSLVGGSGVQPMAASTLKTWSARPFLDFI